MELRNVEVFSTLVLPEATASPMWIFAAIVMLRELTFVQFVPSLDL